MQAPKTIQSKLRQREEELSFRKLSRKKEGVDFFSNDYLGIAKLEFSSSLGHGSTGSRLISGNSVIAENVESELANFYGTSAGLLYNSGYDANIGLLSSVPQRGDTIVYDRLCHASIRDGIRLGVAKNYSFEHNNLEKLEQRLLQCKEGEKYVVVESVYSMDGDQAPLAELAKICQKHNAYLIVDEAHAAGFFGDRGEGLVSQLGINTEVFAKVITFGKAYGSHGAIVLGGELLKNYLINFSRSFIYTTAMSPSAVERISFAVEKAKKMTVERQQLHENIQLFQKLAKKENLNLLNGYSPIQSIIITGNKKVKEIAERVSKNGFMIKAILSPTVPKGEERIRICLHSYNTNVEIQNLIQALKNKD